MNTKQSKFYFIKIKLYYIYQFITTYVLVDSVRSSIYYMCITYYII